MATYQGTYRDLRAEYANVSERRSLSTETHREMAKMTDDFPARF